MMKKIFEDKKMIPVVTGILLAAMLLAGCGGNGETPSSAETAQASAETEQTVENTETEAASSAASGEETASAAEDSDTEAAGVLADGVYSAEVTLAGGTGKARVESPCELTVKDGQTSAAITWSSSHYDFMVVEGETYYPVNTEGNSRFEIPVILDEEMEVQADTTAMSQPHLIDYTLRFTLSESGSAEDGGSSAAAEDGKDEAENTDPNAAEEEEDAGTAAGKGELPGPPEIAGLTFVSEMEKQYAEDFAVYYYADDYKVLAASSGREYLVVPEGGSLPADLPAGMTVIQAPADRIYLAASSAILLRASTVTLALKSAKPFSVP
mgnify:CR=1 FL=1